MPNSSAPTARARMALATMAMPVVTTWPATSASVFLTIDVRALRWSRTGALAAAGSGAGFDPSFISAEGYHVHRRGQARFCDRGWRASRFELREAERERLVDQPLVLVVSRAVPQRSPAAQVGQRLAGAVLEADGA